MATRLREWVLLDTGSTFHVFTNQDLLSRVKKMRRGMQYTTNIGQRRIDKRGIFGTLSEVWLDGDATTNIVSFSKLVDREYHIKYDSREEDAFFVCSPKGNVYKFKRYPEGLYFYNPDSVSDDEMEHVFNNNDIVGIESVEKNMEGFSHREFMRAKAARTMQYTTGVPTIDSLKAFIRTNGMKNCPVTEKDVDNAEKIFGPSVPALKGKTTRKKADAYEDQTISCRMNPRTTWVTWYYIWICYG